MVVEHEIEEKTLFCTSINSDEDRYVDADDESGITTLGSGCSKAGFGFSALTRVKDTQGLLARSLPVIVNKVKQVLANACRG